MTGYEAANSMPRQNLGISRRDIRTVPKIPKIALAYSQMWPASAIQDG
jgi:hypothetical protein